MDRNSIEELLRRAAKLPTSLKTVLDETQALYETPLNAEEQSTAGKKKRRRQDIRTYRKKRREYKKEKGDNWREHQGSLRGQFFKLRREYIRRARKDARPNSVANWEWELSLAEWLTMWTNAKGVKDAIGNEIPAWKARGRRSWCDVQLKRIDKNQSFRLDNLQIRRGKEILWDGMLAMKS